VIERHLSAHASGPPLWSDRQPPWIRARAKPRDNRAVTRVGIAHPPTDKMSGIGRIDRGSRHGDQRLQEKRAMEEQLKAALKWVALGCEVVVGLCVAAGGIEALWGLARHAGFRSPRQMTDVWRRFAGWIVLALEFALAGDIVSTAVAPTWT